MTIGASCLVAWEMPQKHREGGLGVKNLVATNSCLLLKPLH
jgi:hypothetical protein